MGPFVSLLIVILFVVLPFIGTLIEKIREAHKNASEGEGGKSPEMTLEQRMQQRREELREMQRRAEGEPPLGGAGRTAEQRAAEAGRTAYERRLRKAREREAMQRGERIVPEGDRVQREIEMQRRREAEARTAGASNEPYAARLPGSSAARPPVQQPTTPPIVAGPTLRQARNLHRNSDGSHSLGTRGAQWEEIGSAQPQRQSTSSARSTTGGTFGKRLPVPTDRRLTRRNLRNAMLWKEALDKPVGMREASALPGGPPGGL